MSTRATIKFQDRDEIYYVYRHSDGIPEIILKDFHDTIRTAKGRWSEPEVGLLVTLFLAKGYNYEEYRLPDYKITRCFHGDESYKFYCKWNIENKEWIFGLI